MTAAKQHAVATSPTDRTESAQPQPPTSTIAAANNDGLRNTTHAQTHQDACPPRDLIQRCLRSYYRDVENGTATWRSVSQRMQEDLAPYSILKLGGFSLGNISTKLLGHVLVHMTNLRTLDLGFNRITDKGATLLAKALEQNVSLESLYLSGNDIGPAGAKAIAQSLAKNTTLRSLHLSGNNIGEEGAKHLAEGLKVNVGLRSLYIGTNGIGSNGMQCLAEALTVNKVLEELTLGQNKIGSNGIKHIAAAFASGQAVLTTLEIGKNGIDQEGALALAKALCNGNPNCLQNLYIDNNPMGDVGAGAFGALLAKNSVLRVLDLSYSQMSLLGLRDLSMGLAYSSSLLCLLLDGHDWASTQYMKKTNGLTGMSLSSKGASNYAASCIVGAINSNPKSLLLKLTGVDLSLVVSPPSNGGEHLLSEDASAEGENRRPPSEVPSSNKRKNVDQANASVLTSSGSSSSDTSEQVHPKYQRLDANGPVKSSSSSGSIGSNSEAMATASAASATANTAAAAPSYSTRRPPRVGLPSRGSIVQFPTTPAQNRLSLKSPRYESTMEIQVRKVILDIANLPFNADEYATLQTYYLGGCMSPKEDEVEETKGSVDADDEAALLGGKRQRKNSLSCADADLCPACRTSRLAKFRRVMLLKARLESKKEATEEKLLVILRQLHYLIGVFQHVDNADDKIDSILVSAHDPSLLASPPRPRQQTASGLPPTAPYV
uniref:Uncharacterized protein n=1 Tax=Globisporangium ultimum (strain ATCC 200006 / CBS 805.95 / DAOM BR144) TaxID=431595 RepID=K3WXX4_GLOUD